MELQGRIPYIRNFNTRCDIWELLCFNKEQSLTSMVLLAGPAALEAGGVFHYISHVSEEHSLEGFLEGRHCHDNFR